MSWIGLVQAAAFAYFHIAGPTIARKFQLDPYLMDWILMISGLTPAVFGVVIAYWGNKVHRTAWVGALVLLQSVSYFVIIIPHLTHHARVIEEVSNLTHMSLYADDNPELCSAASARLVTGEDEPCYFSLLVIIAVQIITGMANIAYFALGISYLDDNTKKRHVGAFLGIILAVKLLGFLLGYILAWGCLRIDAETFVPVGSYREQIGAWWLGFPILSVLLVVPGLLLSWFPRMLPSEVVEQAAASLLNSAGRYDGTPRTQAVKKDVSRNFFPSLCRLFSNKILMFNILASIFSAMGIINFMTYENVILESRFHVPRPTGLLLGFADPMYSRLASSILKPILISLIIIISGLVIAKARPSARFIVGYNLVMIILTAVTVACMIFTTCERRPIIGMDTKGSIVLLQYCNKNCGCLDDADFRPVCDSNGMHTFYSACHAGCTSSEYTDGLTKYSGCSCVEEVTGQGNQKAVDGPCGSNQCQIGWLVFEFGTMLAYALFASTFIGDLLINLRCVLWQDKAMSIGFWMMWLAVFVNVPGKIIYETIANLTCLYWGSQKTFCHLHDNPQLGDYLSYLTAGLLLLSFLIKITVWFFCGSLKLYIQAQASTEVEEEMQEVMEVPASGDQGSLTGRSNNEPSTQVEVVADVEPSREASTSEPNENSRKVDEKKQTRGKPLKYGPLGLGDRRTGAKPVSTGADEAGRSMMRHLDSEDDLSSSDEDCKKDSSPKVAYRPLDLDSDVESDLSSTEPRSRKQILTKHCDPVWTKEMNEKSMRKFPPKRFPNPDDYGDPREDRYRQSNGHLDGSSKTNSFEFSKKGLGNDTRKKGDFNEIGIPIVPTDPSAWPGTVSGETPLLKDVKSLIDRYEQNSEKTEDEGNDVSVRSTEEKNRTEGKVVSGIPLVAMVQKKNSASRAQSPSGMSNSSGSVSAFMDARSESRGSNSSRNSGKTGKGSLCTDL